MLAAAHCATHSSALFALLALPVASPPFLLLLTQSRSVGAAKAVGKVLSERIQHGFAVFVPQKFR